MPLRVRVPGGLLTPVRVAACLLGLLLPLHLPFTLPEPGTAKMLGWSGRDLPGHDGPRRSAPCARSSRARRWAIRSR
jgi:hypothetical protein